MNSHTEPRWEIFQNTFKGVRGWYVTDSCLFSEPGESTALMVAQSRNSAVFSFICKPETAVSITAHFFKFFYF